MTSVKSEIETIGTRQIHKTKWIDVLENDVRFADGTTGTFTTIEKPDFAAVIAIDADGLLYLVEQYRYAIARRSLEIPMGAMQDGEPFDPLRAARRELEEEVGLTAEEMRLVGSFVSSGGYMKQQCYAFIAKDLRIGIRALEQAEQGMTVHKHSISEVENMIRNGRIDNVVTIAAISLARLHELI
jgi:ADP-ribose pyrophosphatase